MSKVNVNLNEAITTPANVLVTVTSVLVQSQQVVVNGRGILPGVWAKRTNSLGVAQFTLEMGRYRIEAKSPSGGQAFQVEIDVPDDLLTHEYADLLADDTFFTPAIPAGASPAATTTVPGLVRVRRNGTTPIAEVGCPVVADVTELRTIATDASNRFAILYARGANEPMVFWWDNASSAAHDGVTFTVVRPNDFTAAGVWKRIALGLPIIDGGTGGRTAAEARTNLSLFSQDESFSHLGSRLPRAGLAFDNVASTRLTGASGVALGLSDCSIFATVALSDYTPGASMLFFFSHSTFTNSLRWGLISTGQIRIIFNDGAGVAATYDITPSTPLVDGRLYHLGLLLDRDGLATLMVNGVAAGTVNIAASSGIDIGNGNATVAGSAFQLNGQMFSLRVFNRLVSVAEALVMVETGLPPHSEQFGTLSKYSSSFTATADGWTAVATETLTGNTDGIGGVNDTLLIDSGAGTVCAGKKTINSLHHGQRVKISFDVYRPSGNATGVAVQLGDATNGAVGFTVRTPVANTWTTYSEEVILTAALATLRAQLLTAGGSATITAGDKFYIKNVVAEYLGCIIDLDIASANPALSTVVADRAGQNDFTASTTAIQVRKAPQTNLEKVTVGGGAVIKKELSATASLDFPSIAAGSFAELTITVTGAQVNDAVIPGLPFNPNSGLIYQMFVSAVNTVTVRANNFTAGAIDPAAQTFRATVRNYT